MNSIIRRENLAAVALWPAPTVQAAAAPAVAEGSAAAAEDSGQAYARAEAAGRQQGYREGYAEGLAAGRAQAEREAGALRTILAGLARPLAQLDQATEDSLAALALEIARQVLRHESKTQPEQVLFVLREALAAFPLRGGTPWVRLHPEDLSLARALAPEIEAAGVSLVADDGLERGDLILAADSEEKWARPDRRWRGRGHAEGETGLDLRLEERWRQVIAQLFEGSET